MVLPLSWVCISMLLLNCGLQCALGSAVITEEDLIRAMIAKQAALEDYEDVLEPEIRLVGKRGNNMAGFSSWAGKRGGRSNGHQAFSSWAGKRSPRGQQQAFSSWAGKRSGEEPIIHEPEYVRRKRSSEEDDDLDIV